MANTKSAKKATRKIERRTEVNKARRSRMRTFVRSVEDAIGTGDKNAALAALRAAEPEIMRAAPPLAELRDPVRQPGHFPARGGSRSSASGGAARPRNQSLSALEA